jgi:hypothetical protein
MPSDIPTADEYVYIPPPNPDTVPSDARCSHAGCNEPIRLRIIDCRRNDEVSYRCYEHAYEDLCVSLAPRPDLDAVLLFPIFLTSAGGGHTPHTSAEVANKASECPHCHRLTLNENLTMPAPRDGLTYSGPPLCPNCQDSWYTRCRTCARAMQRSGDRNNDDSNVCPSCARYRIFGSKRKPNPVFFTSGESDKDTRFTGAEIELEFKGGVDLIKATRTLLEPLPMGLMHAETDGSLINGVEYVTMPLSSEYIITNRKMFERFYEMADDFADHNATARNAGLHVHMSRSAIKAADAAKMEEMVTRVGLTQRWLMYLTRRSPDRFNQWASTAQDPTIIDNLKRGRDIHANRYRFLNWQSKTVECRGFAGAVDWKHFIAATEFVRALHDFAKSDKYEPKCTAFRKFIENSRYEILAEINEAFKDPRTTKKVGNDTCPTDQRAPGEFSHRGQAYCIVLPRQSSPHHSVRGLTPRDYVSMFSSRLDSAHAPSRICDAGSGRTYEYARSFAAERYEWYTNNTPTTQMAPVTTDRHAVLDSITNAIGTTRVDLDTVYCGAYVFNQLEQLNTMGMLSLATASQD